MKLATLIDGSRDGKLAVVSRDLTRALPVPQIARRMQDVLDDWKTLAPKLEEVGRKLNTSCDGIPFNPIACMSPLPRAYHWVDGSAYLNHVELVRKARGATMPPEFLVDPLMYQGNSGRFLGPREPIVVADEAWGTDLEGEVAVVTDDVPMQVPPADAPKHIKLLMLVNDVSLRGLIPTELAKQFGFLQSKPGPAFSPVAVTPDELGEAWDGRKLSLPLVVHINGKQVGQANTGVDLQFDFGQLIAHDAKTRPLPAGSIIGSGTISNRDRSVGWSCLAEQRMIETIDAGKPTTPFLKFGDEVRIEMFNAAGQSIFGAIEQRVARFGERTMITRSLRLLCEALFDYSGFAPPAELPLGDAVRNYGEYQRGEHSWLLGRSILPLAKMAEYEAAPPRESMNPWRLSALTTGNVAADMQAIETFNQRHEGRAKIDAVELKAETVEAIRALRPTVPANLKAYVEIPLGGDLATLVAALAANGLRAKARTGGLTPSAIPSVESVAKFIVACRAARIPFKFTAGMHAPLRSVRALTYAKDSPTTMMHGFINAFFAAGAAWQDADLHTVTDILAETATEVFDFDDERALWRDVRVSCEFLEASRRGFAISLGSCSFSEPVEGLQKLGWV